MQSGSPFLFVVAISSRGISEAGLLLAVVGALVIALGALSFLRAEARTHKHDRTRERQATAVGAGLVALGLLVQLLAMLTAGK